MIMIPNKLPQLPKKLFNQEWIISIELEGISENGGPLLGPIVTPKCFYSGKAYQVMNSEKQIIRLEGKLIALGDLFPNLSVIATGTAKRGNKTHKIYKCERPLNPDGTVYCTVLELM